MHSIKIKSVASDQPQAQNDEQRHDIEIIKKRVLFKVEFRQADGRNEEERPAMNVQNRAVPNND